MNVGPSDLLRTRTASIIELQPQFTCFIDVKGSSVILACMWAFVCGGGEGIRLPGGEGTEAEKW